MNKKCNAILAIMLCASLFFMNSVIAESGEYSLLNKDYVRVLGRGEVIENSRGFNWPNAGFEFEFAGKKAEVYADEAKLTSAPNGSYFNVALYDGDTLVRVNRMKLSKGWNTIYTEQSGDPAVKKIMVVRSSEACKGTIRMSLLRCDFEPAASAPRERLIEFIGDSFTAGFSNSPALSQSSDYCAENTDNWNSYTGMVARNYNADNNVLAYQGKGVYANRNLNNLNNTMSHQFEYEEIYVDDGTINMSTKKEHKFYEYQPQLVTIWLGTNDAAAPVDQATFKAAYEKLVDNVRAKYPNASILNMSIKGSAYYDVINAVATDVKRGEANKFYMLGLNNFQSSFLGHPDIAEDRRIADQVIAKIDSMEGVWDIPVVGEDDTNLLSLRVDYNANRVCAYGNVGTKRDKVTLMVMNPGTVPGETLERENVAYIGQTKASDIGEYSFEFVTEKLAGEYNLYLNSYFVNDVFEKQFTFKNFVPSMTVTSGGEAVKAISDVSGNKDIKVTLSGFDVPDADFTGVLAVAQYKGNKLETISTENASDDSVNYGTEVVLNTTLTDGADNIKVFYWNAATLVPVFGTYDIR